VTSASRYPPSIDVGGRQPARRVVNVTHMSADTRGAFPGVSHTRGECAKVATAASTIKHNLRRTNKFVRMRFDNKLMNSN